MRARYEAAYQTIYKPNGDIDFGQTWPIKDVMWTIRNLFSHGFGILPRIPRVINNKIAEKTIIAYKRTKLGMEVRIFTCIMLLLCFTPLFANNEVCTSTSGVQNVFYGRVTAVELFDTTDQVCSEFNGRVRLTNLMEQVCPTCYDESKWHRRWFYLTPRDKVLRCNYDQTQCVYDTYFWWKSFNVGDFVIFQAKRYHGIDGKPIFEVWVAGIVEGR